jgi:hypothetical protein
VIGPLERHEIPRMWEIDRREYIANIYRLRDGALVLEPHNFDVPGSPVTSRRSYDARPGFMRPIGCAIGAAVINDNHFDGHACREAFANHAGDRFFLV